MLPIVNPGLPEQDRHSYVLIVRLKERIPIIEEYSAPVSMVQIKDHNIKWGKGLLIDIEKLTAVRRVRAARQHFQHVHATQLPGIKRIPAPGPTKEHLTILAESRNQSDSVRNQTPVVGRDLFAGDIFDNHGES